MRRLARILLAQLHVSLVTAAAYRVDFLVDALIEIVWTSTVLVPLLVVYGSRAEVAGWSFGEALVVVGFFTLVLALLEGVMNPSFGAVVEHIRKGTLDYMLLLPVDAQLMVSTGRVHVWKTINVLTALVIFAVGFAHLGHPPSPAHVAAALLLLTSAAVVLHAVWTLAMCTAFVSVKTDNLTDVLASVLDGARWPSTVFRGATRVVLTFVIPLGLLTTIPAEALLGRLTVATAAASLAEAAVLAMVARAVWTRSLARYTSASS